MNLANIKAVIKYEGHLLCLCIFNEELLCTEEWADNLVASNLCLLVRRVANGGLILASRAKGILPLQVLYVVHTPAVSWV